MDIDNDGDNGHNGGDAGANTLSGVAATSQKKLSGSTMNMKFMQRKNEMQAYANRNQQERRKSSPKKQPTPAKAGRDDPMQMDMDTPADDDDSDAPAISSLLQHQHPHTLGVKDAPVDMTPATTSDMYGISVDIIGRRSFGGFNKHIETTWKTSYRSHTENNNHFSSNNKHVSDEELLARYANLVKHRKSNTNGANNANEDMSRKTIGNFGDKVKPRKKQQQQGRSSDPNRSGEKRKRR